MSFIVLFINNYCIVKYFTSERHNSHSPWLVVCMLESLFAAQGNVLRLGKLGWSFAVEEVKTSGEPIHPHRSDWNLEHLV